jgi:hypothetical protein
MIWLRLDTSPPAGRLCVMRVNKLIICTTVRDNEPLKPSPRLHAESKLAVMVTRPAEVLLPAE